MKVITSQELVSLRSSIDSYMNFPRKIPFVVVLDDPTEFSELVLVMRSKYGLVQDFDELKEHLRSQGHKGPENEFFPLSQLLWSGRNMILTNSVNVDAIREAYRLGLKIICYTARKLQPPIGIMPYVFETVFDIEGLESAMFKEISDAESLAQLRVLFQQYNGKTFELVGDMSAEGVMEILFQGNKLTKLVTSVATIRECVKLMERDYGIEEIIHICLSTVMPVRAGDITASNLIIEPDGWTDQVKGNSVPKLFVNPSSERKVPKNSLSYTEGFQTIVFVPGPWKSFASVDSVKKCSKLKFISTIIRARMFLLEDLRKLKDQCFIYGITPESSKVSYWPQKHMYIQMYTHPTISRWRGRKLDYTMTPITKYLKLSTIMDTYYGLPEAVCAMFKFSNPENKQYPFVNSDWKRFGMILINGGTNTSYQTKRNGVSAYGTMMGRLFRFAGIENSKYYEYRRRQLPADAIQLDDTRKMSVLRGRFVNPSGHLFSILFMFNLIPLDIRTYLRDNVSRMKGVKNFPPRTENYEWWPDIDNYGIFHRKDEMIMAVKGVVALLNEMNVTSSIAEAVERDLLSYLPNYKGGTIIDKIK